MVLSSILKPMKSVFYLPVAITILFVFAFGFTLSAQQESNVFKVVLDAGHGGHDPGNLGNGYMEKNIALGIVLQAGAELEKIPGIEVIYTRDDDTFVDLFVRGEIANKANADLFVSVHCDSHNSNAYGAHTFVLGLHANDENFEIAKKENSVIYLEDNYESRYAQYDINSPESVIGLTIMQEEFLEQSIQLAKMVQDNFANKLKRRDRKVKQAGFIVLHQTFMPSILIETGFLTNKDEGQYLNSKKGQAQMGKAIADAIISYKENVRADDAISFLPGSTESVLEETPEPTTGETNPPPVQNQGFPNGEKDKVAEEIPDAQELSESPDEQKDATNSEVTTAKSDTVTEKKSTVKSNIIFKVQIMASAKELALEPRNFNGLDKISKEPYKNLFRYMYGETDSYEKARILKDGAAASGYESAYIVAYENGVRIPVKQALAKL